jgi:hypothetical protein
MDTDNEVLMLIWNQRRHRQTIPYHPLTNTPSFRTAPASRTYRAFVALFEAAKAQYHQREHVLQIPDRLHLDKEFTTKENAHTNILNKPLTDSEGTTSNDLTVQASNLLSEKGDKEEKQTTRMGPLTFDINPKLKEDKHVYLAVVDNQAKLIHWHYCLGHLTFSKLKQLVLNGEIPRHLAKVKPPAFAGCLFGAMTKVPWRGQDSSSEVFVATKAGQCVSVDQLISMQVGFIAQLKGTLTKKYYTAATVFVDHYSRLKYIHLMTKLTSEETVEAKRAFEHFAKQHGVHILHYHCNNRQFADNAFKNSCSAKGQQLTFCGVNAHFQNGIAKKAVRDLQESARKQLLHVRQCWPAVIHLDLWPYALRSAVHLHNTLPVLEDGTSRLECFSSIRIGSKMKHHHAFGFPVFALENDLAAGSSILHWSPHAHLGVNLGSSPSHARNVYLVLNLHTGCISPQYHCQFDNFFEMVKHSGPDVSVPSAWQQLFGLTAMTQTPSMEHHNEVLHPSKCMQFGNNPVARSQESDNTISASTPIFF